MRFWLRFWQQFRQLSPRRPPGRAGRAAQFWPGLLADQAGFSLVEVVVSIVVVSTTSVALAGAMSTGYLGYRVAEADMAALRLATHQLEVTKSDASYLDPPATYSPITPPAGYGITSEATLVYCKDAAGSRLPAGDPGCVEDVLDLEMITVTVTHGDSPPLVVEDYKANR